VISPSHHSQLKEKERCCPPRRKKEKKELPTRRKKGNSHSCDPGRGGLFPAIERRKQEKGRLLALRRGKKELEGTTERSLAVEEGPAAPGGEKTLL